MGKNTIIATSCMDARSYSEQPVWRHIADEKPNLLLLLGDQIYMDTVQGDSLYKRPWLYSGSAAAKQVIVDGFARDMHDRYADQWAVSSFRACVVSIRKGGGRVLLTWDDHDFAWNNSCGAGTINAKGVVPQPFKDVAYKLFAQFAAQVQSAETEARYPDLNLSVTPTQGLASTFAKDVLPGSGAAVSLALLDGRTEREPHANGSPMIGPTQLASLKAYVEEDSSLLIVASGSPLKRRGTFADVSWWQDGTKSVKELTPFIDIASATRKPIIYVGGDIHSNKLLGFPFAGVPIYDVLASGAAKTRGEGNYVRITVNSPTVTLDSRVLTKSGATVETAVTKVLDLTRWMNNVQTVAGVADPASESIVDSHGPDSGAAAADEVASASFAAAQSQATKSDVDSFGLAVFRKLGAGGVSTGNELTILDNAFVDEFPPGTSTTPDSQYLYAARYDETSAATTFQISESSAARIDALKWAMQGDASTTPPLVIYIHGFNNSFYDAIVRSQKLERLYNLRAAVAPAIPGIFTFSWPAGKNRSVFDAPEEFQQAMNRTDDAAAAFAKLVDDIQAARTALKGPQRELVLLARSTGAWVLEKAVRTKGIIDQLNALFKCVVFSQPLTSVAEHKEWFNQITVPKYVTINTNDRTLLAAQTLSAVEEALGCNVPEMKESADNTVYFDTTHGTEVLSDHDVIMRDQREARYTDASLYGFHLYALHGADPTSELKRINAFVANQRYAKKGFQLWEPRPIDIAFGAA